jgi:anti-sigma factor RsiW
MKRERNVGVTEAGQPHDVTCEEILAAHSDYLDGLLPAHEAARLQWHLSSCAACGRYDRVVRRGAELARELPAIAPSDDFAERLQHRLFHLQDGPAIAENRGASGAGTIAVAGVIALLAWSPLLIDGATEPTGYSAVAQGASPGHAFEAFVPDEIWFSTAGLMQVAAPAMLTLGGDDVVQVLSSVPGPYSPLTIEPPVHRTVRTVSIE